MTTIVINALIAGLLGAIAIVVTHQIVSGEDTTGWSSATSSMFALIPTVVGIVVIVGMFVLLTKIRGGD